MVRQVRLTRTVTVQVSQSETRQAAAHCAWFSQRYLVGAANVVPAPMCSHPEQPRRQPHSIWRPDNSWAKAGPVSPDDAEAKPFIPGEEQPADEVTGGAVMAQGMGKPGQRRPPTLPDDGGGWVCDHLDSFPAAATQRGSTAGHGAQGWHQTPSELTKVLLWK